MEDDEEFNLQIQVPVGLLREINAIARKEDRKRNQQLIWLLKDAVKRYSQPVMNFSANGNNDTFVIYGDDGKKYEYQLPTQAKEDSE